VEERQRGEFWTDCQVQLLLAAIILTGVGRSRSFMRSKVKIISAADGDHDMSPKLTRLQYPVRLAFGTTLDRGQGQSLLEYVLSHRQVNIGLSRATCCNGREELCHCWSARECFNEVYRQVFGVLTIHIRFFLRPFSK
jgi:hypothetical protein